MIGRPFREIIGFGVYSEKGLALLPLPPAINNIFSYRFHLSYHDSLPLK
jgi:hypothetical protein